jgi:alpha-tubulin suppressor-like RCC1 family protein
MNHTARILFFGAIFTLGGLAVADVRADVRSRVKIRMKRESVQPAKAGETYAGVLEVTAPKAGLLETVEIGGAGWQSSGVGFPAAMPMARGETVAVPFQANVTDATKLLEIRASFDGTTTRKRFDLSPQRFARRGKDRPIVHVEPSEPVPAPDAASGRGGGGTRGCDDQQIRFRGRFEYERAGRDFSVPPDGDFNDPGDVMPADNSVPPDGDFTDPGDVAGVDNSIPPDGDFNDPPDVPPAIIGADGIWFQIMDDDSPDPIDEVMFEGYTDINGYFDVTICWDDCDITGCDDPDIYIRFECDTGVVNVQDGYDPLEEDYSWSTAEDAWDDFTGNDLDFGAMRPTVGEDPAVHIHNSITRVHRFVLENSGDYITEVDAQWPEDDTYYDPFFEDIYIQSSEEWNEATQTHEWSHHMFEQWLELPDTDYCNGNCDDLIPNPCQPNEPCEDGDGGHCVWCQENDVDAWNEGFANWMASVALRNWQARYGIAPWTQFSRVADPGNNDNRYTLETVQQCCNIAALDDPWTTEGFVAALLRDIEDPPQDPGQTRCPLDALGLGADEILAVVRDTQPIRIIEFIERFRVTFPNLEHDFRSTASAVSPVYVSFNWPMPPIQVQTTSGCGSTRAGGTVTLNVQTNASRYSTCMRWQHDGADVTDGGRFSGATTDTLTITNVQASDAGQYTLVIRSCDGSPNVCDANASQSVTSQPIPVHVFGAGGPGHHITGWGYNINGELGRGTYEPLADVNPADVINLANAVAVSGGYTRCVAALADGTAWSWGYRYLGNGTSQDSATPVQVNNLTDVVAVATGGWYASMALDAQGHVWTWGSNWNGILGYPPAFGLALNPGQVNLECVVDISMGRYHAAALTSDGSLWIWGENTHGELGQVTPDGYSTTPLRVPDLSNVIDVECGMSHTLALRADGTLWACGWNQYGQLGDGTLENRNHFVQVTGLANVASMAGGDYHSLARLSNGEAWAWGYNGNHTLGTGAPQWAPATFPISAPVLNVDHVRAVAAGNNLSVFTADDGTIWTCGSNGNGQLGRPFDGTEAGYLPAPVDTRVGAGVLVSVGSGFVMAIAPGARIIAALADQLVAGASTAHLNVSTVGEAPLNYQWNRHLSDGSNQPLADASRFSGTTTPTLTISQTEIGDSGVYNVRVSNTTNDVTSSLVTLSTPPFLNDFDTSQDAEWFGNERGNWSIAGGAYAAGTPGIYPPVAYTSFDLPQADFLIELDVVNASHVNFDTNGGIYLRSTDLPLPWTYPRGVVLAWGEAYPWGGGDIYWHFNQGSGYNGAQNIAHSVYTAGQTLHLRIEVRGDTFTCWANDAPTPTTTFTTPDFPAGKIALLDGVAAGTAFDNIFIQTLTDCEAGSGIDPVRIVQRPQSQNVPSGTQVTLNVGVTGGGVLNYQWLHNGFRISSATAPMHTFIATAATAGRYECTVTNVCGSVGSYPAFVTIGGPPGDIDDDGHVTLNDLTLMLSTFGRCDGNPGFNQNADLDGDGCIGLSDLTVLLANFGA